MIPVLALAFVAAVQPATPLPPTAAPVTPAPLPPGTPAPLPPVTPAPLPATPVPPPPVGPSGTPLPVPPGSVPPAPVATTPPPGMPPVPAPTPTVTYTYHFVPGQPKNPAPGAPVIYEVDVNSQTLVSHGEIDLRILTSPDVTAVSTKSNGKGGPVPKLADGVFVAAGRIPGVPFIAHGLTFTLSVTAANAAGQSTTVGVPLRLK